MYVPEKCQFDSKRPVLHGEVEECFRVRERNARALLEAEEREAVERAALDVVKQKTILEAMRKNFMECIQNPKCTAIAAESLWMDYGLTRAAASNFEKETGVRNTSEQDRRDAHAGFRYEFPVHRPTK